MSYQLRDCVWELTLACCFSCKYCGSSGGRARENELSTEECLDVARQLAELGCQHVSLIGGEVFMRKDWEIIVKTLTDYGIRVVIITNGFLLKEETVSKLQQLPISSVAVSLDGPREVHDCNRHIGSHDRALETIEALTRAGINSTVISTLNAVNVSHLEAFYQELLQYPIRAWQLQACTPMGNAAKNQVPYQFDAKEVLDFVNRHVYEAPFAIGVGHNIGYYAKENGHQRGTTFRRSFFNGCTAGIKSIGIDSVGNVRGCESMYDDTLIEGNLRQMSLKSIWESEDSFAYNRTFVAEQLTGHCASCRFGRYCGGGCRAYNYFAHGKMYESPLCIQAKDS